VLLLLSLAQTENAPHAFVFSLSYRFVLVEGAQQAFRLLAA
jgi:hypothetical protein